MVEIATLFAVVESNALTNFLMVLVLGKVIEYDINLARLFKQLEIEYKTVYPVELPRFHLKGVEKP